VNVGKPTDLVGQCLFLFFWQLAVSSTTVIMSHWSGSAVWPTLEALLIWLGEKAIPAQAAVLMLPPLHVAWGPPAPAKDRCTNETSMDMQKKEDSGSRQRLVGAAGRYEGV